MLRRIECLEHKQLVEVPPGIVVVLAPCYELEEARYELCEQGY